MRKQNSFTLIETLVVLAVIVLVAAVTLPSINQARTKARDARRVQDMNTVQTAAEQYYSMNSYAYPVIGDYVAGAVWTVGTGQTILENFPADPKPSPQPSYTPSSISTSSYCVCAQMENTGSGNSAASCNFSGTKDYYCVKNQQ